MKKITLLLIILFTVLMGISQEYIKISDSKTDSEILYNSENGFVFRSNLQGFYLSEIKINNDKFIKITNPDYFPDNNIGYPELPVMAKLIELPGDAEIEINILNYREQIIDLNSFGIDIPLFPNQESLRKDQDPENVNFAKSNRIYIDKEFYSTELVEIKKLGVMRGVQVGQLILNPFSYDIESNILIIKNDIEVEIKFKNNDFNKAAFVKAEKYSPVFEQPLKKLWNYNQPQLKSAALKYPIKYVIISDRMFESALDPFIKWKTKKGFKVVTAYTDEIGRTTESIKNYLQNLYDSGTSADPAPSYLLIVGDVEQVPSFSASGHVTDMYYCEFDGDGDYIPEMFFGRFSATTVDELLPQIEKTLMNEQYTFQDPSFLGKALLVAGNDASYSPVYSNGQVNYAYNYYFNQDHGVTTNTYVHPESANQISEILERINNGAGYLNYSAHCIASGWQNPNFFVADVHNLTNDGQYFFSVGNCCKSNKFDSPECFGEALLRADKKGAVVHIGGSDNTYWSEDFYWSVGFTSNVTPNPTYENTGNGVYDHLFHENGEDPYVSAGQMNYIGNISILESTSSRKKYYFEIYHVMGDPSLMAYIGMPQQLDAEYEITIPSGISFLNVNTEPDAYVALSTNGDFVDAGLADSEGNIQLNFDVFPVGTIFDVVITKQFRIPYSGQVEIIHNNYENDVMLKKINTPVQKIHISQSAFMPAVDIINVGNMNLHSAVIGYTINGGEPVEFEWEGDLETFGTEAFVFPEISLSDGVYDFTAYVDQPNGHADENPTNNRLTRRVTVYSGDVSVIEVVAPVEISCRTYGAKPEIIVRNNDTYPLTSLKCEYECSGITEELIWTGNIAPGESFNIKFPAKEFPNGMHTINFNISEPNSGTNLNTTNGISMGFNVDDSGFYLEMDLQTDSYGHENRWELLSLSSEEILYQDGPFASFIVTNNTYNWCLEPGCYKYTIYDSYGDGMRGSSIGGNPPGHVIITNQYSGDEIFNLSGNNPDFSSIYSAEFCLEPDVYCPGEFGVELKDTIICLTGASPRGGSYTINGEYAECFNPMELGLGAHPVNYKYQFEGEEKSCTYNIVCVLAGIDDITAKSEIDIYPNPTTGIIHITTDIQDVFDIEIVNIFGQVLYKYNNISRRSELDISNLPSGTYIVRFINGNNIFNKKISLLQDF